MIEKFDETYCNYGIIIGVAIPAIIYVLLMKPEHLLQNAYVVELGMIVGAILGFITAGYISIVFVNEVKND
jgi:VIT1/CCC1 family predicted Fe2+/Mn2+ transporter